MISTLQLPPVFKLTDEQFEQLAAANQDLQLELTAKGELIIMPPTGGETGDRSSDLREVRDLDYRSFNFTLAQMMPMSHPRTRVF